MLVGRSSPGHRPGVFTNLVNYRQHGRNQNSLVVDGAAQIAVTRSAAIQVVTQTPVLILKARDQGRTCVIKSFSVRKEAIKVVTGSRSGFHVPFTGGKPTRVCGLASLWGLSLTCAFGSASLCPQRHALIPCLCFRLLLRSDRKASRRLPPGIVTFSYHTLVTVSSSHQTFTEAASCLLVTGVSSRKCPQRAAATGWTRHNRNVQ